MDNNSNCEDAPTTNSNANLAQFDIDIVKINFVITYLTEVAQNWFEMGFNQEDQGILQD